MMPLLHILTPLVPAPEAEPCLGRGAAESDGEASFAALLSGVLTLAPAEDAADTPTDNLPAAELSPEEPGPDEARASAAELVPIAAPFPVPLVAETPRPALTSTSDAAASSALPKGVRPAPPHPIAPPPTASAAPPAAERTPDLDAVPEPPANAAPPTMAGAAPRETRDAATGNLTTTARSEASPTLPAPASAEAPPDAPPTRATPASEATASPGSEPAPFPTPASAPTSDATAPSADAPPSEPTAPTSSETSDLPTTETSNLLTTLAPPSPLTDANETSPEPLSDESAAEAALEPTSEAQPAEQQQEGSFDDRASQDAAPDEALSLPPSDRDAAPSPERSDTDASIPAMREVADGPTAPARAETPPSLQRTLPVAWLRAVLDQPLRSLAPGAAWQSLQIQLDDGEGTLTIQTRRDDDRVSVAVGFSDGHLRGLASASADRIQAVLQEHFGASVDLSLTSDGSGDAPRDDRDSRSAPRPTAHSDGVTAPRRAAASPSRTRLGGSRHEWVG